MFRVVTFNAGLAVGVLPLATQRLPLVIDALAAVEADLLFVQEFWLPLHWHQLVSALSATLPHHLRPEPLMPASAGVCSEQAVRPLLQCGRTHCAGLTDEALAQCVVARCSSVALALPGECLNCVASNPSGTLDEIVGRCVRPHAGSPPSPRVGRGGYGTLMAYGGSFGTGLLSRYPLEAQASIVFQSTINARGAVHAQLAIGAQLRLHVFAVHLSPGGSEQGPQVDQLLAWIDEKVQAGRPTLLLGDLNTTPGSVLFSRLEAAGFRAVDPTDTCSTFEHDGLGTGVVRDSGWRLDHVLVRDLNVPMRSRRVLDDVVSLRTASGETVCTTLSDHFAVLAELNVAI
jgi:endonuclease/exonuclease/phosphatase family metal-dependent hydrolase